MAVTIHLENMSREEKLQTMEAIWTDLSKDDAGVESPVWHEDILIKTETRVAEGQENISDWTAAKQILRKRFE